MSRRYNIYPTLLDEFAYYQSQIGSDDEQSLFVRLLDKINRVPQPKTMEQVRGTALNILIDWLVIGQPYSTDMTIEQVNTGEGFRIGYKCRMDGFEFIFSYRLVDELAKEFALHIPQEYVEAELSFTDDKGEATACIYGYPDYIFLDRVKDLKTTKDYTPWKYKDNWQHIIYPWALVKSKMMSAVDTFTYVAVEVKEDKMTGIIDGVVFREEYAFNETDAEGLIRDCLTGQFIPFLEHNRYLITNKKIFGEE